MIFDPGSNHPEYIEMSTRDITPMSILNICRSEMCARNNQTMSEANTNSIADLCNGLQS